MLGNIKNYVNGGFSKPCFFKPGEKPCPGKLDGRCWADPHFFWSNFATKHAENMWIWMIWRP